MRKIPAIIWFFVLFVLSSCSKNDQMATTSSLSSSSIILPTNTLERFLPPSPSKMFEQNFESVLGENLFPIEGNWLIKNDGNNNKIYCNEKTGDWSHFLFGWPTWRNYTVEMQLKFVELDDDSTIEVYTRIDTGYEGYRTSLSNGSGSLGYYSPPQTLASYQMNTNIEIWYYLRVETYSNQINVYINDILQTQIEDDKRSSGMVGFGVAPNTLACVDDIQVWALSDNGDFDRTLTIIHPSLEVVTNQAVTGDGANAWGGHQTRIVRTQDGVFTAYTIDGNGDYGREWRLAWRNDMGNWIILAKGDAGKDPVNLLASLDGTIHIIGWPNQTATMWSGKLEEGVLNMTNETIPGLYISDWPYNSASIDQAGNICVLSSLGGETVYGEFKWACKSASEQQWVSYTTSLDFRYCYTYLFPEPDGQITLVSTRDVLWEALGYIQPKDSFDYVFNAIGVWHTQNIASVPIKKTLSIEEKPTERYPFVVLNAFNDVYQDQAGNIHILYNIQGETTKGAFLRRHLITTPDGEILSDIDLPLELGEFSRIFQNNLGNFYILGSSGVLYPAGRDGLTLGEPILIDFKSYVVESTGFGISVPRTGTTIQNSVDVVYPTNNGKGWIYFNLPLP